MVQDGRTARDGAGHGWARLSAPCALALLAGVGAAFATPAFAPVWLCAVGSAAGLFAWVRSPFQRLVRLAGAFAFGLAWAQLQGGWTMAQQLPPAAERTSARVTGQVRDLPVAEARRTRFRFRVDDAPGNPAVLRGRELALSWYDAYGEYTIGPRAALAAGARWSLDIKAGPPRGLVNPGGFDSERHALAQRTAGTGFVSDASTAKKLSPPRGIDAWRERMAQRIDASAEPAVAPFLRAMAVGDTRGLDARAWEILRANGLTHLIAISGFHVALAAGACGVLVGALWWLFPGFSRWSPRGNAMLAGTVLGSIAYAAVAGFALPTVRTVLMLAVVALARLARRGSPAGRGLVLSALAVLLCDPLSVLAAGFWLSFGGVAWLMWCAPQRGTHWLKAFLGAQAVATLGLLPLTVALFGHGAAAGPLSNLVAIPWWSLVVIPLALLGTGLEAAWAGAGEWAWHAAGWCFSLSWPLFEWIAASPAAVWWVPEPHWLAVPLAQAAAASALLPRGLPGRALALMLWLGLLWPDRRLPACGEADVVVLDVGQGLAVVVRTARHALLYDAGPAVPDGFDAGDRVVVPALRALGHAHLDRLLVSHHDADHAGGVEAVLRAVRVFRRVAPPGAPLAMDAPCELGDAWQWDGVAFEVLHPPALFPYLGNESSCVLAVTTRHGRVLLTGDIGHPIERRLVRRMPGALRSDVVLAGHHGSGGSSAPAFVAATGARIAVVSAGHRNAFGHPRPDVVERWQAAGAEVLETSRTGALTLYLRAGGLAVRERRSWRARPWDAARRERLSAGAEAAGDSAAILSAGK